MANWTDLSGAFGYGTKLTSSQMQQLRDNVTALAEGAGGAPSIVYNALSLSNELVAGDIAANAIEQSELKTSAGSASKLTSGLSRTTIAGGQYSFHIQDYITYTGGAVGAGGFLPCYATGIVGSWAPDDINSTIGYANNVTLYNEYGNSDVSIRNLYVTSSGEVHWIFLLINKATGEVILSWESQDHPVYGCRGLQHPFHDYDPLNHEIIVINPTLDEVERMLARTIPKDGGGYITRADSLTEAKEDFLFGTEKPFLQVFHEMFDVQESQEAIWPDIPITVALPKIHEGKIVDDWRFMPRFDKDGGVVRVEPVQIIIPKPDFITPLQIKEKKQG